jgi:hypothetical protein
MYCHQLEHMKNMLIKNCLQNYYEWVKFLDNQTNEYRQDAFLSREAEGTGPVKLQQPAKYWPGAKSSELSFQFGR